MPAGTADGRDQNPLSVHDEPTPEEAFAQGGPFVSEISESATDEEVLAGRPPKPPQEPAVEPDPEP